MKNFIKNVLWGVLAVAVIFLGGSVLLGLWILWAELMLKILGV